MKKIYSCQHQKNANHSCSICAEERNVYHCSQCQWNGKKKQLTSKGNCPQCGSEETTYASQIHSAELCTSCEKCNKKISSGEYIDEGNKYTEKWIEAHDCQPSSEKFTEDEERERERRKSGGTSPSRK